MSRKPQPSCTQQRDTNGFRVSRQRFRPEAEGTRSMSELPPFLIKLIIAAINGAISAVVKVLVEHLFDD
jgi:hypothetical protein